ncbi:hypothetical protein [Flavobacterium sp. N3904]|uniref:hypothetical protein n=1 Tax=Flavobacterium sp. N3904 TaxID=2986835 RepID=UPI0022249916|nr:hypothetical protein [Flavobacterium sp. N3904]
MEKCLICNQNDANQTGSHIVPHFLVKRIYNEEGESKRDKELGFAIDENDSKMFFGRAILPEKLEDIYGPVDEQLLEQNNIDGIVDNFFCDTCEKKLAIIESEYSKSLKIISPPNTSYQTNKISFLGFIFWTSVIWRISIMPNSGFKLKDKDEKKLQRILSKYLNIDINSIVIDVEDSDLLDIGYKILRAPNFSDTFPTFQYGHPFSERPYFLVIDEYIIYLYFKKSHLKGMINDFFGSYPLQEMSKFNTPFQIEEIYSVDFNDYKAIIDKMVKFFAEKKISKLVSKLDLLHQRLLPNQGRKMDLRLKEKILKNIANSDVKPGKRNLENELKIMQETIMEFYQVKE